MVDRAQAEKAPTGSRRRSPKERGEEGFSLVVLVVAITLLHIALAVAMPLWSTSIRREREEEAIFRGLQYAEAIRVFQARFGRYPTELKELIEVEPRSIRQLWTDPLSRNGLGGFGLLVGAPPEEASPDRTIRGGRQGLRRRRAARGADEPDGGDESERTPARDGTGMTRVPPSGVDIGLGRGRVVSTGAIRGVYIHSDQEGIKTFQGSTKYSSWLFSDAVIPVPTLVDDNLPSVRSDWIGRPFKDEGSNPEPAEEELDGRVDRSRRPGSRKGARQPGRSRRR